MIAKLKEFYTNHRNFVELKERGGIRGFGFPKRLDEHRELVELIYKSGLLKDKPWVVGWLRTQDEFLEFCFLKLLGVGAMSEAIEYRTLRQKPNYDQLETPPSPFVRDKTKRLSDIHAVSLLIWPDPSPSANNTYWDSKARELYVGIVLFLQETRDQIEKEGVDSIPSDFPTTLCEFFLHHERKLPEELKPFLTRLLQESDYLSNDCVSMLRNFLDTPREVGLAISTTLLCSLKSAAKDFFLNPDHMESIAKKANASTNQGWVEHAYPLKKISIVAQCTRHGSNESLIGQLEVALKLLKEGFVNGCEHDDDFGFIFKTEDGLRTSIFDGEPSGSRNTKNQ